MIGQGAGWHRHYYRSGCRSKNAKPSSTYIDQLRGRALPQAISRYAITHQEICAEMAAERSFRAAPSPHQAAIAYRLLIENIGIRHQQYDGIAGVVAVVW